MADKTPEEQWTEISYGRSFLIAVLDQVDGVWDALATKDASAPKIKTDVNDVPILISKSDKGNEHVLIEIGNVQGGEPQVVLDIPKKWVTDA
jgi:hypothetical protein